jgi:hypothetical protein
MTHPGILVFGEGVSVTGCFFCGLGGSFQRAGGYFFTMRHADSGVDVGESRSHDFFPN